MISIYSMFEGNTTEAIKRGLYGAGIGSIGSVIANPFLKRATKYNIKTKAGASALVGGLIGAVSGWRSKKRKEGNTKLKLPPIEYKNKEAKKK